MSKAKSPESEESEPEAADAMICGIVRPISPAEDCSETHWADVERIIKESLKDTGFTARLVSVADDSGVIHARIVQNLADNPMVICDVSTKNANVMFELGMRLAFDMPTIVIKDDKTKNPFDTSPIEYIPYPRDLNYYQVHSFKTELARKITATYESSKKPGYTTFLKYFKRFTAKKELPTEEVAIPQAVLDQLSAIRTEIRTLRLIDSAIINPLASKPTYNARVIGDVQNIKLFQEALDQEGLVIGRTWSVAKPTELKVDIRALADRDHSLFIDLAHKHNLAVFGLG